MTLGRILPDGPVGGRGRAAGRAAEGRRGAVTVSGWGGVVSMAKLELPREDAPAPTADEEEPVEERTAPVVDVPKEEPS